MLNKSQSDNKEIENKNSRVALNIWSQIWFRHLSMVTVFTRCPSGVMVKALVCRIVLREFELESRYYVHFRKNTLWKGMNPLILPSMG